MKIDFHVHTSERSSCARSDMASQIQTAIQAGLDSVAITDHYRLVPANELAQLNQRYHPFLILNGIEISADGEDWLILGLPDPALEVCSWNYPDLYQFVRSRDGVIVLAHPFRYHADINVDIQRFPPDAIEIRSNNIRNDVVPSILSLANRLMVPTLCNSDAHTTASLGRYYNVHPSARKEETDLLAKLKAGEFQPSVH